MEQASNVGDTQKLHQIICQLSGKLETLSDSVREVNGGFITDSSAKVDRWRYHFEHLHNFDKQLITPSLPSVPECPATPLLRQKLPRLQRLHNNKAPGEDGIPIEIYKACVETLAPWLHEVIEQVWTRPNQAGFRAGHGCVDQLFTLRRILEFRYGYQQPTAVRFIDFAAAFESVHCESLWRIMEFDGVLAKIIALIKIYRSSTARVLVHYNLTQPFDIRSGVRQGCILSLICLTTQLTGFSGRPYTVLTVGI
ncbi:unnamed protein product [Schistocephalus solidus]|uniref:Reverse transcriptase domain-containing protein n=1 Tax=Schistocephalus solidus TaxID=70667 RepID=A0A183TIM9_SCHSO|nr:unnamed protein product [Schistocephalus solidus]